MQSVAGAQVEAARLRSQLDRVVRRVSEDDPDVREHAYKHYGDFLVGMPERLRVLEGTIQRAAFVLATEGPDSLRRSMPIGDLALVEEALSASRVASSPSIQVLAGSSGTRVAALVLVRGRARAGQVGRALRDRVGSGVKVRGWRGVRVNPNLTIVRCWGTRAQG